MSDTEILTPVTTAFEYGWCHTDHKDGADIRGGVWRTADYMFDAPYREAVERVLTQLGLPYPEKKQVFRGTNHDLLFIDSHGVVLRIGPLNIKSLMHPGILQPLGWIEDNSISIKVPGQKDCPLTVAIYPGVALASFYKDADNYTMLHELTNFLMNSNYTTSDMGSQNCGVIRVCPKTGQPEDVSVVLDIDNQYLYPYQEEKKMALARTQEEARAENPAELADKTIRALYNEASAQKWIAAFETHQPLRLLFWAAFQKERNEAPDREALKKFWDTCAEVLNKPKARTLPTWGTEKDADGNITFKRRMTLVSKVALCRPWTKKPEDIDVNALTQFPEELRTENPGKYAAPKIMRLP